MTIDDFSKEFEAYTKMCGIDSTIYFIWNKPEKCISCEYDELCYYEDFIDESLYD